MKPASNSRRAFWSLVGLATASAALLLYLLFWQAPQIARGVWLACQDAVSAVGGYLPAIGLALPLGVLLVALARFIRSIGLQLWNTRLLVQTMEQRLSPMPADVNALAADLGLDEQLFLVDDARPYTFTQGLLHPQVWLSSGLVSLLDGTELRAVLVHERFHVRQRDPLRVLFSRGLAEALFFLPLASSLRDAYLAAKEVEADQASAADNALASALLKLLRQGHSLPANASLAAIGPLDVTRTRIERLLHQSSGLNVSDVVRLRQIIASVALALALVAGSYVATTRAAAPLDGGECGYTTAPVQQINPPNYTPVDFGQLQ